MQQQMFRLFLFALLALALANQAHVLPKRNKQIRARAIVKRQDSTQAVAVVGTIKPIPAPLPACNSNNPVNSDCDTSIGSCCITGSVCRGKICQLICTLDSTEPYCDSTTPCNTTNGYICTANRCRPPATAVRVANDSPCDQGTGNTLFCIPAKGLCVNSVCQKCTQ